MARTALFIFQLLLVAGLLTAHYFALQNDLYWHYLWLDIPMHFLGGFWAALACVWFLRIFMTKVPFIYVFAGVLVISIAWEVFEFIVGFQREDHYMLDTALDLVMDSLGGICGFMLGRRMVQLAPNAQVEDNSS
jgi:hypothetical protein